MFNIILYSVTFILLCFSYMKSKEKTKKAVKKALKSFENILPQFLFILLLIGIMLAILDAETISLLLGKDSGMWGIALAAVIGSITLIPGFISFPLAATLLESGAGYAQITVFVTTLMMVGFAMLPLESSYFGRKIAIRRNCLALVFALAMSLTIGGILS